MRSTFFLLLITISALPLYAVRSTFFGIPTNLFEIIASITIGAFIGSIFFEIKNQRHDRKDNRILEEHFNFFTAVQKKFFLFSLLLIFAAVSSALVNNDFHALGIVKSWFILPIVLAAILVYIVQYIRHKDVKKYYTPLFFIHVLLHTLLFITTLVSSLALSGLFENSVTFDGRLRAFYQSPNYLAMFSAPGFFIALFYAKQKYREKIYYVYFISILSLGATLFFTYSYASWCAIIGALSMTVILKKYIEYKLYTEVQKKRAATSIQEIISLKNILYFVSILLVFFSIFFIAQVINPKDLTSDRSSISSRLMIYRASIKIISENPIFGIGPGNFQEEYLKAQKYFLPYLEWAVPEPHNLFLAFYLHTGILGLITFIALIIFWFRVQYLFLIKKTTGAAINCGTENDIKYLLIALMLYIVFHGLFDTPYWKNDLSVLFWIISALGIIEIKKVYDK